jgi:hypothetical protein
VKPEEIIVVILTQGRSGFGLTFPSNATNVDNNDAARIQFIEEFRVQYVGHDVEGAFARLRLNYNSFDLKWNRDFRVDANCPKNEKRGREPYARPKGWVRFRLNVSNKFNDGNEWLGMCNGPGEWVVAYHGKQRLFVRSILETPLTASRNNSYGRGIYCTPDITETLQYTRIVTVNSK